MKRYNPSEIEPKWQAIWEKNGTYRAEDFSEKPKMYVSGQFPYPSAAGLHVGHAKVWAITDAVARFGRQNGKNVMNPMGWDTFGMPAENYAIKTGVAPQDVTRDNIANFKKQFKRMGMAIDWDREVNTSHPEYYRWTQWIFAKLYEKGLAYQAENDQWWCPVDKTVLANEQVEDGKCWRCKTEVEKKKMRQWFFKITEYAEELLAGLDELDWPEGVKTAQRNWIGRSEGAEIEFVVADSEDLKIKVFTTRADTIFGATFMVLAPEHPLVYELVTDETRAEVEKYVKRAAKKSEIERQENKEKTGVFTGSYAINPASGERMPIYVADYVLMGYGEGAIMAVPAHDERDYEFAEKYDLPIKQVIMPAGVDVDNPPREGLKMVGRESVIVHLRNNKTGRFALLQLRGAMEGIVSATMGGIDRGEAVEDAARREVEEEIGLSGVKIVRKSPFITSSEYCAAHKGENRRAITQVVLAEVDGLEGQKKIDAAEEKNHTVIWVDEDKVRETLTPVDQKVLWDLIRGEMYTDAGEMINSGQFSGMDSVEAGEKIVEWLEEKGVGRRKVTYRMRDWLISRQRYWGAPIPIVYDKKDKAHLIAEKDLPVVLPVISDYQSDDSGRSALAKDEKFLKVMVGGEEMTRETDTMDGFACSSWYLLRYCDPRNTERVWDPEKVNYWGQVDYYVGGEHSTTHMLYVRMWTMFFRDLGLTEFAEPIHKFMKNGQILAEDGRKMSKSLGNTIDPLEVIDQGYGADCLRTYILFMVPPEGDAAWSTAGLGGVYRFLNRVWTVSQEYLEWQESQNVLSETRSARNIIPAGHSGQVFTVSEKSFIDSLRQIQHATVKKVTEDMQRDGFNTAVAALMEYVNELYKLKLEGFSEEWQEALEVLAMMIAPFAPHMASELFEQLGRTDSIEEAGWPSWDEKYLVADEVEVVVQVNGKLRGKVMVSAEALEDEERVREAALDLENVRKFTEGKEVVRVIFVKKNRLVNVVVK